MRQHRETNYARVHKDAKETANAVANTCFLRLTNDKPYELTELKTQFVRYTVEGVMPRIGGPSDDSRKELAIRNLS